MIRSLLACVLVMTLGAVPAFAAEFDHAFHLNTLQGMPCSTCHVKDAESIVPDKKLVCSQCHDADFYEKASLPGLKTHGPTWALNHRQYAKGHVVDCSACHEQDFCLECHTDAGTADEFGKFGNNMVNVHRSDFRVTHPIAARTNPQLCASCHEKSFCVKCHEEFDRDDLAGVSHRRGWSDLKVAGTPHSSFTEDQCQTCHPNSVLPAHEWAEGHAREARKNLATCQACHPEGEVCLKCHSARTGLMVNPHPDDWNDMKGRIESASGGKTCRRCH